MFGYKVKLERTTTHYEAADEPYGDWSQDSHHTLDHFITREDEYPDVVSSLDLKDNDEVYVVWAQWSDGDSFGSHRGANAEAIAIFTDSKCAFDLKNYIEYSPDLKKIDFKTSDGQHIKMEYLPWDGYFESLDFISIGTVIMVAK